MSSAPGLKVEQQRAGDVPLVVRLVEEHVFPVAALQHGSGACARHSGAGATAAAEAGCLSGTARGKGGGGGRQQRGIPKVKARLSGEVLQHSVFADPMFLT